MCFTYQKYISQPAYHLQIKIEMHVLIIIKINLPQLMSNEYRIKLPDSFGVTFYLIFNILLLHKTFWHTTETAVSIKRYLLH